MLARASRASLLSGSSRAGCPKADVDMAHTAELGTIVAIPKPHTASTTCSEAWSVEQLWTASVRSRLPEQLKKSHFLEPTESHDHETSKFKFGDEATQMVDSFTVSLAVTNGDKRTARHELSRVFVFSCFSASLVP